MAVTTVKHCNSVGLDSQTKALQCVMEIHGYIQQKRGKLVECSTYLLIERMNWIQVRMEHLDQVAQWKILALLHGKHPIIQLRTGSDTESILEMDF